MAIGDIVVYQGEQYYVVGEATGQNLEPNSDIPILPLVALNKIEVTNPKHVSRVMWVNELQIIVQASQLHWEVSDWTQGILYGNKP